MTRAWLDGVRRRAWRKRVWFTACTRLERGLMDLTIRYVDTVRSARLALILGRVVVKILKACWSRFVRRVDRAGAELAARLSRIGAIWGMAHAAAWKGEKAFIRWAGVNAVNSLPGWQGRAG
jgi:hypothetical protein